MPCPSRIAGRMAACGGTAHLAPSDPADVLVAEPEDGGNVSGRQAVPVRLLDRLVAFGAKLLASLGVPLLAAPVVAGEAFEPTPRLGWALLGWARHARHPAVDSASWMRQNELTSFVSWERQKCARKGRHG
jgi:hypothetical protein